MSNDVETIVKQEIDDLHQFLVGWFSGSVSASDFDTAFLPKFDPDLRLISPAGSTLTLDQIEAGVRKGYGTNPDFRIAIRNVKIRRTFDRHILATYEEWQRNALDSKPPKNTRIATVLFKNSKPLRWLHIHETWMPRSAVAAGHFDF